MADDICFVSKYELNTLCQLIVLSKRMTYVRWQASVSNEVGVVTLSSCCYLSTKCFTNWTQVKDMFEDSRLWNKYSCRLYLGVSFVGFDSDLCM